MQKLNGANFQNESRVRVGNSDWPIHAEFRSFNGSNHMDDKVCFECDLLLLHLTTTKLWQELDGSGRQIDPQPASITVLPATTPVRWAWQGKFDVLVLSVSPEHSRRKGLALDPRHDLQDPFLFQAGNWLGEEIANGGLRGKLFADSVSEAILEHLLVGRPQAAAKQMDKARVKRAIEFIEANYSQRIGLDDLSSCVGLSRSRFVESFKAAVGMAPHAFLLRTRAEKVRSHLISGQDSLADIAHKTGFSDQAHMTRVVKRVLGRTPAAFRLPSASR